MEYTLVARLRRNFLLAFAALHLGFACNGAYADMPDYYSEPGFNANRDYPQLSQYETVDAFTGKLQLHHTDILIKGNGGMDLAVTRSYTSSNDSVSNVWTMRMGRVIGHPLRPICTWGMDVSNIYNPVLELPDGSQQVLSDADTAYMFISSNLWKATCDASGNFLNVTSPAGTVYRMDYQGNNNEWYPSLITDRNGNTISITYQNYNGTGVQITSITTSEGTQLTFNYTLDAQSGMQLLTSITDGGGSCGYLSKTCHQWTYSYVPGSAYGVFNLSQVTLPDGTTWQYGYNGALTTAGSYQINSVTNPMGGVSTFTYGYAVFNNSSGYTQDTVVNSRTVAGVGTWAYAYTPSTGIGVLDSTTITDPLSQTETYYHFGYNTAVQIGNVWEIGLLMQKITGPLAAPVRTES